VNDEKMIENIGRQVAKINQTVIWFLEELIITFNFHKTLVM
jgi:hypothetical protein